MDEPFISFHRPGRDLCQLSDEEFLQRIRWRDTATATLVRSSRQGDVGAGIRKLCQLLAQRSRSGKTSGKRDRSHVLWSRYAFSGGERQQKAVSLLEVLSNGLHGSSRSKHAIRAPKSERKGTRTNSARKRDRRLQQIQASAESWLVDTRDPTSMTPFELLSLFDILLNYSSALDHQLIWKLWRTALTAAVDLYATIDESVSVQSTEDQRLLIGGELPWQLGLLFAEVEGAPEFARSGRQSLCRSLLDGTDTDGTPDAELLERLPLWLAPLVRSSESAARFEKNLFSRAALDRFEFLIQVVAPMCRPDGRIALSNGSSHDVVSLLQNASKVAGFRKNQPTRRYLSRVAARSGPVKSAKAAKVAKKRDWPVTQSDWAQLACLRNDWSFGANSLVVAYHGRLPLIDLSAAGHPVFSGEWGIEVHCGGDAVAIHDGWECVCWHSDEDADYLELHLAIDDTCSIDRQALLSRTDNFAILADVVKCPGARRIEYTSRLPMVDGIQANSSADSRECVLQGDREIVRVFPLALPQDRVLSTEGGFGGFADDLVLKQASATGGLYAPVVIDWSSARRHTEPQWRTLTVTESGEIVRSDSAAAHRLRIGSQHLFIYRSLRKPASSRAALGQHTPHESLIGRLDRAGNVSPILIVES